MSSYLFRLGNMFGTIFIVGVPVTLVSRGLTPKENGLPFILAFLQGRRVPPLALGVS